jgi:hypothetical protein
VLDLSVLELCDTSDSSSKRHRLVTLGGYHLKKIGEVQGDCEGGLVFL